MFRRLTFLWIYGIEMSMNVIFKRTITDWQAVKFTYLRRQRQPMQMTVKQIIKAAAAIITITTNTTNKCNKIGPLKIVIF